MTKKDEHHLFELLDQICQRLKSIEEELYPGLRPKMEEAVPGDVKFHIPNLLRGLMRD